MKSQGKRDSRFDGFHALKSWQYAISQPPQLLMEKTEYPSENKKLWFQSCKKKLQVSQKFPNAAARGRISKNYIV